MAAVVYNELDALLNLIVSNTLIAGGVVIHLFQNNVTFDNHTVIGGLTEASYTSYAAQTLGAWGTPSGGSGGGSNSLGPTAVFAPGILATPQLCYGWYATDSAGNLLGGDNFASPLQMGGTTVQVDITPTLSLTTP